MKIRSRRRLTSPPGRPLNTVRKKESAAVVSKKGRAVLYDLDAKALKVFEIVARCQSMKQAAAELNTVQSNVTSRIRTLEDELGVTLFERRHAGMKLTPAGLRLLPHAFEVRAALSSAKRAIEDIGVPFGPLAIGCRKSTSALHLTHLLKAYVKTCPDVDLQVRTDTSPLLTQQVLERRLEGALVCDPVRHSELISEVILDEELVVLSAPHIESLRKIPRDSRLIVLGQGSLYEQQLKTVLLREGLPTNRVMELGTLENIIGCVSAGLGVTLFPQAIIDAYAARDLVRPHKIPAGDCRVQTLFIRRRDAFVSSALAAFLDCARTYAKACT